MRAVLSDVSKKKLQKILKRKYKCNTLRELSKKLNINQKTLEGWFYSKTSIPEDLINTCAKNKLDILETKEDNWGQIQGGKKGYKNLVKKYGVGRVKLKQSLGGKNAAKTKEALEKKLIIDVKNPLFLEFYGALLGDGWLSIFKDKNKFVWIVGLCGNLTLDKKFILYMKGNVIELFKREGYIREKKPSNTIEFVFKHKILLNFMNKKLNFPIGKKENLYIHKTIYSQGFENVRHVIRGVFDTDGSFYIDNNHNKQSPCISIHMKAPKLIKQIGNILIKNDYKISYSDNGNLIKLRGKEQLNKWLKEIGSSNPKHLDKITTFINPFKFKFLPAS